MIPTLLLLLGSASLAQEAEVDLFADEDEPELTWTEPAEDVDPTATPATAAAASTAPPSPISLEAAQRATAQRNLASQRYTRGMRTARVGFGIGAGGVGAALVGTGVALGGALDLNLGMIQVGSGIALAGGVAVLAGAPVLAAGAHQAALGVRAPTTAVTASWILLGSGVALSVLDTQTRSELSALSAGALLGSYVAGGIQMGVNGRNRYSGRRAARPWVDPTGRRLGLSGSL